jgi:hypothetical protein
MASDRVRDLKALLDRLAERAGFGGEPTAEDQALRGEAIGGFVVGGAQLPDEAARWPQDAPASRSRARVSWEPGHGLQLACEDGQWVCKVSPYDGHVTVAHAYGDPSLLGVVFG